MKRQDKLKVVVITGATAGVGRATARAFAAEGTAVGIISRDRERLTATRRELEELGARVADVSADVAEAAQVEAAAEEIEGRLGPIDVWINNAMVSVFSFAEDMIPEEYLRVTRVTYLGYVHGTLSALKRMRPRNRGTIVQVGSALAYRGIPLQSAYCASKHAIKGFTESLRSELLHLGSDVRLSMVHLPAVNTPQFTWVKSRLPNQAQPVPPIYQPEVAARAIHWAAHSGRRELLVGASTFEAILANTFLPFLVDRYLGRYGVSSQQTQEPKKDGPENLFAAPPGDYGCHGNFDEGARRGSPLLWMSTHRREITWAAGLMAGAMVLWRLARRLRGC
jgi:short-subunit dehydrogenase